MQKGDGGEKTLKKLLLKIWNAAFDFKKKAADGVYLFFDFFYRRLKKAPSVMTNMDTIRFITENRCCVSRYGDAEIRLAAGTDVFYQKAEPALMAKLREVLGTVKPGLLVCLPDVFEGLGHFTEGDGRYWKRHLARYRRFWYRYPARGRVYGNAFISRVYMCFNEKEKAGEYFDALKKIWSGRDVVLVEGEKSRLGVGNDLFAGARSVRRILGPSAYAFSKYDELLAEVRKIEKTALLILAMGPVATLLPYDLADDGYQALDLGNIDTEYEWYLRGCTKKTPIENKLVYEAGAGEGVGELEDETYQSQIIARVL